MVQELSFSEGKNWTKPNTKFIEQELSFSNYQKFFKKKHLLENQNSKKNVTNPTKMLSIGI